MKTRKFFNLYIDSYRGLSTPAWMLALVMLINRTGAMVLPFMAIYMRNHLHFSLEQAGIVLSCFGLGSLLGNIAGGWLTDKLGSFKVQCLSLFLAAPLYIVIGKLYTVEALSAGIFTLTFIADLFRPANSAAITSYAKPENLTRAFSLNRMAINLGFSFGPFLGGLLAAISYDLLFWGNAIGCLMAAILFTAISTKGKEEILNPTLACCLRKTVKSVLRLTGINLICFSLLSVCYTLFLFASCSMPCPYSSMKKRV